jgi:hypothetical protein
MTTIPFRKDSLWSAAGLLSCALFTLGLACSDDGSGPTYSVPAAAGAAGTLNRGSGTLLPDAPGGTPAVNNGTAGTPGFGIAGAAGSGAGTGGLPGTGGASGFGTAGTAGAFGGSSGGAAGTSAFGSAGVDGTAGAAGTFGAAGMGGDSDLLP